MLRPDRPATQEPPCPPRPTSNEDPMDRQQVFELIRDRLADILEIEPSAINEGAELHRRPRGRLAGPHRAGRGPRGGAQRAHRRLPHRRRGPRRPEDGARRRRLRRRPAVGALDLAPGPTARRSSSSASASTSPPDLLAPALVHRSWCAEHPGHPSNERLEFLGDAVLGVVVTDHVYRVLPRPRRGRPHRDPQDGRELRRAGRGGRRPRRRGAPAARQGRGALRRTGEAVDPGRRHGGDHRRRLPRRGHRRRADAARAVRARAPSWPRPSTDGADHKSRLQEMAAHLFGAAASLRRGGHRARPRPHVLRHRDASTASPTARARAVRRSRPSRPPPGPPSTRWSTTDPDEPERRPTMAELPELETIRRELEKESVGKRFKVPEVVGAKVTKRNGNKKVFQGRARGRQGEVGRPAGPLPRRPTSTTASSW